MSLGIESVSAVTVESVRDEFPAIVGDPGKNYIFADAPTGTQVHRSVITAMSSYLEKPGAHLFGTHPGGLHTIGTVKAGREHCATFFNCLPEEIVFGPNSTTLVFHMSRSLGSHFKGLWEKEKSSTTANSQLFSGPWQMPMTKFNIVVTNLEHDTNVSPFVRMAEDLQDIMEVRRININTKDCTLPLQDIQKAIDNRTVMVAIGAGSNACGTINPIKEIAKFVKQANKDFRKSETELDRCLFFVDAVHYAPHHVIDVQAMGCDFLVCSPFKFFGPHTGLLFGKSDLLHGLRPYKLKACTEELPGKITQMSRWETGTINFEGIAGITAVIQYIASLGTRFTEVKESETLRNRIIAGYKVIHEQESKITETFLNGVSTIPGLKVYGNNDPNSCRTFSRTPTFAVRINSHPKYNNAFDLADVLQNDYNIVSQAGSFYAIYLIESLGVKEDGGVVRIGFTHYNTIEEIERVVQALKEIALSK